MESALGSIAGLLAITCGLLFWLIRIANEINAKLASLSKEASQGNEKLGKLAYIEDNIREIWLIARQR